MPVVRYFIIVGVALLGLLFAADAYLPKTPTTEVPQAKADLSVIRIHSDQKWPERIVIDTTLPTITSTTNAMRVVNIPPASLADTSKRALARETVAQAQTTDLRASEPKRKRRTITRSYTGQPPIRLAQQPRFGFFGNSFSGNNIW